MTNTEPGCNSPASPPSPNNTASVCCALTTTLTITSQARAISASVAQATPPSAAKAAAASARTSYTCTVRPARRRLRAMPEPIAPRPTTPTRRPVELEEEVVLFMV